MQRTHMILGLNERCTPREFRVYKALSSQYSVNTKSIQRRELDFAIQEGKKWHVMLCAILLSLSCCTPPTFMCTYCTTLLVC